MGNLLWLIAIGALFFFMMRRGCGAGHRHGRHGQNHEPDANSPHKEHKRKSGGCH